MNIANKMICPHCAEVISPTGDPIHSCEKTIKSEYSIVLDDTNYGIAFGLEIKIHELSLENAKRILAILNWNKQQKNTNYDW